MPINPLYQQNLQLQLLPLGYAILATLTGDHPEHIAPSLDVDLRCVRSDIAKLYKAWRSLHDIDHRQEWVYAHMQLDPNIVASVEAARTGIMTPRDAATEIERLWKDQQKERELSIILNDTSTQQDIISALARYQSIIIGGTGEAYTVDMTAPPPANDFLFVNQGTRFLPKKEMTAFKAKAKSGKTQVGKILAATAIASKEVMGLARWSRNPDEEKPPYKVLFVDTEQSKRASYKLSRSILQMAGLPEGQNSPFLDVVNLRMMSTDSRLSYLQSIVSTGNYDYVILDGIKDLCVDINDNKEADRIVTAMLNMAETYDIALSVVLHENPSKDSDKMRGHLGTEILNKAHDVFELSRKDDIFNVIHTDSREKPVPTWAFHFEPSPDDPNRDILAPCEPNETRKDEGPGQGPLAPTKEEKHWNQFTKIWETGPYMSYTQEEIIQSHLAQNILKETTCKRRIKEYTAQGRLRCDGDPGDKGTRYSLQTADAAIMFARISANNGEAPIVGVNSPLLTGEKPDEQGQLPF